jgi:hypothetical protein
MRLTFLISMLFLKSAFANVAWGTPAFEYYEYNDNVMAIYSTGWAFAVLKNDKTVEMWGHSDYGGDGHLVATQLTDVMAIYSTNSAFAALKNDGDVVTWGSSSDGGDS